MEEINIVLCDDCKTDLEIEHEAICEILQEMKIAYKIDCYDEPDKVSDKIYDIVFLDIEMNGKNGLDTAKSLLKRNKKCIIIFITNYSVYLDTAFDVNAFRFLPKPLDRERLQLGIDKAIKKMYEEDKVLNVINRANKSEVTIKLKSVIFIENCNRHTRIVTEGNDFIAAESFSHIKNRIKNDVDYFASPHSSLFVNLRYVAAHNKLCVSVMRNNKIINLDMSRRHYQKFADALFAMAEEM